MRTSPASGVGGRGCGSDQAVQHLYQMRCDGNWSIVIEAIWNRNNIFHRSRTSFSFRLVLKRCCRTLQEAGLQDLEADALRSCRPVESLQLSPFLASRHREGAKGWTWRHQCSPELLPVPRPVGGFLLIKNNSVQSRMERWCVHRI